MKIISLSILSITLSVSLFARENPFEPTDHFLEQKEMIIKTNEQQQLEKDKAANDKLAREIKAQKLAQQKDAETKAMRMAQMKKDAEAKKMTEMKDKQELLAKKKKAKAEAIKIAQMKKETQAKKIVVKKAYIPEIKENFKILPFVKIYVVNDVLTIKVDKKYKLLNQDILKPVKKLLFDFKGKVSFYTVRKDIVSENFKSLAVGTHMEENYFRVVIDLPYDIINYTEKIDSKNGIITITKKK